MEIRNFEDFCQALDQAGFSLGGGKDKGIFALIPYTWENQQELDTPVKWHTGDKETDPWEWRMRVLEEKTNYAYAKVFFGVSGYITREYYGYFLSARRQGLAFQQAYEQGKVSYEAKRIYQVIAHRDSVPMHALKPLCGFGKEDGAAFDKAITELQMKMYITMCGRKQKMNQFGQGYGWNSTVFCTVESFWQQRGGLPQPFSPAEGAERIRRQVQKLNPSVKEKNIEKFIFG